MMLALMRAKKAIKARLRSQGVRLTLVLPKDINAQAREYLIEHREQLMAEAEQIIATSPLFARYRLPCAELLNDPQKQNEPKSTTSSLQISGAK